MSASAGSVGAETRTYAMQMLYRYRVDPMAAPDICPEPGHAVDAGARAYLEGLFADLLLPETGVETLWRGHTLGRSQVDDISWAILQIGTWELQHCRDIPVGVSISAAVDLAHRFGSENAYKFVNAVLHQVAEGSGRLPV